MSDIRFGILMSLKDSVTSGVKRVTTSIGGMKQAATDALGKMNKLESGIAAIGGAMLASRSRQFFSDLIQPAAEFEHTLSQVKTRLNETGVTTAKISDDVLKLSMAFGSDAQTQAKGFFQALDDGAANSADAVKILTSANKLSKAGVVDFGASIKSIQDVLNAYGKTAEEASHVAEVFLKTDIAGANLGVNEISNFMQRINPIATELSANFEEITASVATMTSRGVNARQAFMSVGNVLAALQSHEEDLLPLMHAIGEESLESAIKTYGFTEVLEGVIKAADGNAESLKKLGLSGKYFNNITKTLGDNAADFRKNLKAMQTDTGLLDEKFKEATDNSIEHWNKMKAAIAATKLEIGQRLLAALEPVIEKMQLWAEKLQTWVHEHPRVASAIGMIAAALAALGVVLGFVAVAAGVLTFVLSPIGLVILAVSGAVAGLIAAFYAAKAAIEAFWESNDPVIRSIREGWRATTAFLSDAWLVFKTDVLPIIQAVGRAFDTMTAGVRLAFQLASDWISGKLQKLYDFFVDIKNKILEELKTIPGIGEFLQVASQIRTTAKASPEVAESVQAAQNPMGYLASQLFEGAKNQVSNVKNRASDIRQEEMYKNTNLGLTKSPGFYQGGREKIEVKLDVPPMTPMVKDITMDRKAVGKIVFDWQESQGLRGIGS